MGTRKKKMAAEAFEDKAVLAARVAYFDALIKSGIPESMATPLVYRGWSYLARRMETTEIEI